MRYTEKELQRPDLSSKPSLLKYFVSNFAIAPYRLCREVSNKLIYLGQSSVLRVFNCAIGMNVFMMLADIYRMFSAQSISAGGVGFLAKLLACGGLISTRIFYLAKSAVFKELKNETEEPDFIPPSAVSSDIGSQEMEKGGDASSDDGTEIDLADLLEDFSEAQEEEQELSRQVSCAILDTVFYPSTEAKDLLNGLELSYSTRAAFSIERDFLNLSSESSIEEIASKMYEDPSAEYGEEDEALSFQDIEDLLAF